MNIEQFESRLELLESRLARVEGEHKSLLKTYDELAAGRETLRAEFDQNSKWLGDAFDKRVDELVERLTRTTTGGDEALAVVLPELAKELVQFLNTALDSQELRIKLWVAGHLKQMDDLHRHTADLIEKLQRRVA